MAISSNNCLTVFLLGLRGRTENKEACLCMPGTLHAPATGQPKVFIWCPEKNLIEIYDQACCIVKFPFR